MSFILLLPFLIGADPSSFELSESLRKLPVVDSVKVIPAKTQATRRIIHVLDWHYVDEASFVADIKDADEELSEDEIKEAVEQHRKAVRKVQKQEKQLILFLVSSDGLDADWRTWATTDFRKN